MTNKTYAEQLQEHVRILNENGLNISEVKLDSTHWIRCHTHGESKGRGEYSYISNTENLNNGLLGIRTSFRGPGGFGSFRTYGLGPSGNEAMVSKDKETPKEEWEAAARRAYGFWSHSALSGKSDYLERKGVGYYGVRFRSSEQYGDVAVVPMHDEHGKLWNYQLLNPNGTKRFSKGGRTEGLFHRLGKLKDRENIGIAESYVTAATCQELSGVSTVCAFSSENLAAVAQAVRLLFPASPIILFADNDRHLENQEMGNKGLLKAQQACDVIKYRTTLVKPEFNDLKPSKEASDWNDLVRLTGTENARVQLMESLKIDGKS